MRLDNDYLFEEQEPDTKPHNVVPRIVLSESAVQELHTVADLVQDAGNRFIESKGWDKEPDPAQKNFSARLQEARDTLTATGHKIVVSFAHLPELTTHHSPRSLNPEDMHMLVEEFLVYLHIPHKKIEHAKKKGFQQRILHPSLPAYIGFINRPYPLPPAEQRGKVKHRWYPEGLDIRHKQSFQSS